ncbi:hypothetical protein ACWDGI_23570 [Streptomyces sp. NPDC001220]
MLRQMPLPVPLRGYQQLLDDGLIDLRRGWGAVMIAVPAQAGPRDVALQLVEAARQAGFSESRAVALLRDCWAEEA